MNQQESIFNGLLITSFIYREIKRVKFFLYKKNKDTEDFIFLYNIQYVKIINGI